MLTSAPEENVRLSQLIAESRARLQFCSDQCSDPHGIDFPSLALYEHMIQMADGIDVLSEAGTSAPTIPLLRAMMESLFYLEYITQKDYENRSSAWLWGVLRKEIEWIDTMDPECSKSNEFRTACLEEASIGPEIWQNQIPRQKKKRQEYEGFLEESPLVAPAEREFEKSSPKKHRIHWYNLFSGPSNLFELAKKIKRLCSYRLFYQSWSRTIHANEIRYLADEQPPGSRRYKPLRDPSGLDDAKERTITFLESAFSAMKKIPSLQALPLAAFEKFHSAYDLEQPKFRDR